MSDGIPKYLYKYRNFDNIRHLDILLGNSIYFSQPSEFNDPFECSFRFICGNKSSPFQGSVASAIFPCSSFEEVEDMLNNRDNEDKYTESSNRLRQSHLMYCLSESGKRDKEGNLRFTADDGIQFAHYSKDQTGFCVEFDTTLLHKSISSAFDLILDMENPTDLFRKVKYIPQYPDLDVSVVAEDMSIEFMHSKYERWGPENEWRIIIRKSDFKCDNPIVISKEAITAVYLGYKTSKPNENLMLNITKNANIPTYRTYPRSTDYDLDVSLIQ